MNDDTKVMQFALPVKSFHDFFQNIFLSIEGEAELSDSPSMLRMPRTSAKRPVLHNCRNNATGFYATEIVFALPVPPTLATSINKSLY